MKKRQSLFADQQNFDENGAPVEPVSTDVEALQTENAELQTELDSTETELAETELEAVSDSTTELGEDIEDIEGHIAEVEAQPEGEAEYATECLRRKIVRTAKKHNLKAPATVINLSKEGFASLKGAELNQSLVQAKAFVATLKTGLENGNKQITALTAKVAACKEKQAKA